MSYYAFMGHLIQLETNGKLEGLEEISGASAGSLAGFTFLIGRSNIEKLVQESLDVDLTKCMKIDIINFIKRFGVFKMSPVRERISKFCYDFIGKHDITFKELYDISDGIKLHIPAFSVKKKECEYFSVDVTPDMSVIDAVCMSIAVPFLFESYRDHMDGAITEFVPFTPFINKDPEEVYVIRMGKNRIESYNSIVSFIFFVFDIFWHFRYEPHIQYETRAIDIPPDCTFDYKMDLSKKKTLFALGCC